MPSKTDKPPFTTSEITSMRALFLANININGSGAVVAAPDHNTGPGGDYYFHWERDGALTMTCVQTTGLAADHSLMFNYSHWVVGRQAMDDIHGIDVRTEPKYQIPSGAIFDGAWCRPQNDGPGLRATALMLFANKLLDGSSASGKSFATKTLWPSVQRSLDYLTSGGWSTNTCDLWEEVRSTDLFWNRVTMKRALTKGAELATRLGDATSAAAYRSTVEKISDELHTHMTPSGYLIEEPNRRMDGAVVVGLNMQFDDSKPTYAPSSIAVAKTVNAYNGAFCAEYPLNIDAQQAGVPGVLYGRYPGDTYDGGNPWILTTAALAQILYRVACACASGDVPSAQALSVWSSALNMPALANATADDAGPLFASAGDAVLARIAYYVRKADIGFRLDEQLEKHTGKPTSAKSLTWSYAEVFNALHWRDHAWSKAGK